MKRIRVLGVAAVLAGVLVTGCGPAAPTPTSQRPTFDVPATSTPGPSDLSAVGLETPSAFVTAPPVASDVTVSLSPRTYGSTSDACYGLARTVTLLNAPPACETQWQQLQVPSVPGEDITAASPIPRQAQIAAGIDPATGMQDALAFYRYEVVSTYLVLNNDRTALEAMDTPAYVAYDRILQQMLKNAATVAQIPACSEPVSIRVTKVTPDVQSYLRSLGWPGPSSVAIVSTFPACDGILFQYKGNTSARLFGNNAAATVITTGTIQDIAPFGKTWVMDGYAICGIAAVKSVCGV